MKRRKMLLLLFCLVTALTTTEAQTADQRLVVWQKNGEKVYIDLTEQPVTTFEDGQLVITTSDNTCLIYPLESILRYTYEEAATEIARLPHEQTVQISSDGTAVTFYNLKPGATVSLYAANGILMDQRTAREGSSITLSIANQPSGLYLVKSGNQTIKMMKP